MAAPPKMPRAPGGCHRGRAFVKRSGPMSVRGRRERTFSMGEWWGRDLGGLIRVGCFDIVGLRGGRIGMCMGYGRCSARCL